MQWRSAVTTVAILISVLNIQTIKGWEFELRPQNTTAQVGQETLLTCKAPTDINPIYLYSKETGTLTNRVQADLDGLRITNIQHGDEGWYKCTVNSDEGIKSARAYLHVIDALTFSRRPHNVTVSPGHTANLRCAVTTSSPVTYTWLRGGQPITNSERVTVDAGSLSVSNVQLDDVEVYTCKAFTSTMSGIRSISAEAAILIPGLTSPKFDQIPHNVEVPSTSSQVVVRCAASGIPTPSVEWKHNGKTVSSGTSTFLVQDNGNLHVNQAPVTASGVYSCIASNIKGTESHSIVLTVTQSPTPNPPDKSSGEILGDTTLFITTVAAGSILIILVLVGIITWCKCGRRKQYRSRRSSYSQRSSRRRRRRRRDYPQNYNFGQTSWDTDGRPSLMMAFPDDSYHQSQTMPMSEYDCNSRPVSFNFAKRGSMIMSFSGHSRKRFSPSDYPHPGFAQQVQNPTYGLDDIESTLHRQMRELDAMAASAQSTPRSDVSSRSHRHGTPQKKRQTARATSTPKHDRERNGPPSEAKRFKTVSQMMSGEPFEEPEEWGPEHEDVLSIQANIRMSRLWEVDSTLRAMRMAQYDEEDSQDEED